LIPVTRFGRSVALPAARIRSRQRHFSANPPSIAASLEPVVDDVEEKVESVLERIEDAVEAVAERIEGAIESVNDDE